MAKSTSEINESLLIAHNIACAASVVAVTKGVTPSQIAAGEMDDTITGIRDAYRQIIKRMNNSSGFVNDIASKHR
jgi:hypothetical protein